MKDQKRVIFQSTEKLQFKFFKNYAAESIQFHSLNKVLFSFKQINKKMNEKAMFSNK